MRVFGLTGGIGMGKSAAARWLKGQGIPVVDTDVLARDIVQPGQPALEDIRHRFGAHLVDPDGQLRRDELARIVFADSAARRALEQITHPRIRDLWKRQVEQWRSAGVATAVVVIPLLFETGAETDVDLTLCVGCSAAAAEQRLLARGWTAEQIAQRVAAQWPIERKLLLADFVVWTEGGLDIMAEQLDRILRRASAN